MSQRSSFYITTPIYYVNGNPHIGHAYTTIAADVAARWHRHRGRDVRFLTGTDEHGQKVLEAAEARGMTPREHCDDMVARWQAMMDGLDVSYDRFIRTTDADHERLVHGVLQQLWEAGQIYKDQYRGWYLVKDEVFVTEKERDERLATGELAEGDFRLIEEANYFFRMGSYQQALLDHIEAKPDCILPASRRNEVLGFLRKPLGDLCISRPKSRMSWGIELPFDADFVTYVWFDALLNYLTGTGYTAGSEDGDWTAWWPCDYHLIGKDILTTHSVYWTTMLLAIGVPLPQHIYAHGWWVSSDGAKMGKSAGNAIDVELLAEEFGVDPLRYFLMREIAFGADGAFSYDGFLLRYNADLANDLGNLAHRGLSMSTRWLDPSVPPLGSRGPDEEALVELAREVVTAYATNIEALQFHKALDALWSLVKAGNKYVDTTEPWSLNRDGHTERLQTVLRHVQEVCFLAGALLLPVMPSKAASLLSKLGRPEEAARAHLDALLTDPSLALCGLAEGVSIEVGDPLFPRFAELPPRIAALFAPVDEPAPKPRPKQAKRKKGPKGPPPVIGFDVFQQLDLRAGRVVSAEQHPDADKLLVLTVDVGEDAPRTVVAGLRSRFAPEELVGLQVVVVANLAPATLRGVESQGMVLAAGGSEIVGLVSVDAPPGTVVR